MEHKAGFVNIIGNPNVGKSTLMNALVGEKLSIVTSKAQTTRQRVMGIVNGDDFQIVYSDTPGILKPNYKLQSTMVGVIQNAMSDADIILYVTDMVETIDKHSEYLEKLANIDVPVILAINKVDLANQEKVMEAVENWKSILPKAEIFVISALKNFNLEGFLNRIVELLPVNEPFFPKDELTDRTERFFAAEIIREKIFLNYKQEIPYSSHVVVEAFKDTEQILRIQAVIITEKESQKGIIIGNKGESLKKTATASRLEMEKFFGKKVFLEVFVKVEKNWRENDRMLRTLGYQS
ncbi:MAG TPA: GTPase Era [Bacteroidales bacterium]|nr:GTPase Era [Bacteroidales bacterium]